LIAVAGISFLIYLLAPVLMPFIIAALLSYLGNPLVDRLVNLKLPRLAAVVIVFIVIFLLVVMVPLLLIPLVEKQIAVFIHNWPNYIDWIQQTIIPWIQGYVGLQGSEFDLSVLKKAFLEHWQQVGGTAANILSSLSKSGLVFAGWLANLVLIPVVTFYLLRDWAALIKHIRGLIPRSVEPIVAKLAHDCDVVLGTFMRGQLLVMLALGFVYSIGLWLVGLDLALLIGMLAGLVSFVPYLGFIIGIIAAGIAAIVQFHDLLYLVYVVIVFGVGQLLESMVLTPLLVGDRIGLHPVGVIFAIMAGGQLFGFVGILLALPAAAVIAVVLRYVYERYVGSELYSSSNE
jgi:predicted PurR-regulated permease PerM